MASFTGTIYLTTNQINGKIYIGQTVIDKKSYIGSGKAIKLAIKKYGKCNFNKIILLSKIASIDELNKWEEFYINLFNSRNPKIGYNIKPGGKNARFNHTLESIDKIKIRSNQEDNRCRIRKIQKLAAQSLIGTHKSKEEKLRMVSTKYGSVKEIEVYTKDGKKIYVCNFSTEAAEFTGVKKSGIKNNLVGLAKSAGGYIFKYKEI